MLIVDDLPALQRALRERAEALDISRERIDELAGITKGYAAKLLCAPPMRFLGVNYMFPMLGALGLSLALVEGDQRYAKRADRRKPGGQRGTDWRDTRYLAVARDYGLQGARKALKNMSAEQISAQRSNAAKARWTKWRAAHEILQTRPDLMQPLVLAPQKPVR